MSNAVLAIVARSPIRLPLLFRPCKNGGTNVGRVEAASEPGEGGDDDDQPHTRTELTLLDRPGETARVPLTRVDIMGA